MKVQILKILSDKALTLPIKRRKNHFPSALKDTLRKYIEFVDRSLVREIISLESRDKIENLYKCIYNSVDAYYKGYNSTSFTNLSSGLQEIAGNLIIESGKHYTSLFSNSKTESKKDSKDDFYNKNGNKVITYRVRLGTNEMYRKDEMFHIPFQLRKKVTHQRYSINGLPCLYLANSIYVCWLELGKPDINSFQISRLEHDARDFRILDFTTTAKTLLHKYQKEYQNISFGFSYGEATDHNELNNITVTEIKNLVTIYPLLIACSIVVKNPGESFIPEYIIPRQVLEWVRMSKNLDGVKFFSTKTNSEFNPKQGRLVNYAIPVKSTLETGVCKILKNNFKITEPISYQILSLVNEMNNNEINKNEDRDSGAVEINSLELIRGVRRAYSKTIFGRLEHRLNNLNAEKIK